MGQDRSGEWQLGKEKTRKEIATMQTNRSLGLAFNREPSNRDADQFRSDDRFDTVSRESFNRSFPGKITTAAIIGLQLRALSAR